MKLITLFGQLLISATAVKRTSVEELRAALQESWMTPITKPDADYLHGQIIGNLKRLQAPNEQKQNLSYAGSPAAEIAATHRTEPCQSQP